MIDRNISMINVEERNFFHVILNLLFYFYILEWSRNEIISNNSQIIRFMKNCLSCNNWNEKSKKKNIVLSL